MSEFILSFSILFRLTQKEGICKSVEITTKWVRVLFGLGLLGLCEKEAILLNEILSSENKHILDIYVDVYLVIEDCWALFFS